MSGFARLFGVVVSGRPLLCDWSSVSPEKYVAMLAEPGVVPELTFFLMPGTGTLHICESSPRSLAHAKRTDALTTFLLFLVPFFSSSLRPPPPAGHSHPPWLWGHLILYRGTGWGVGGIG